MRVFEHVAPPGVPMRLGFAKVAARRPPLKGRDEMPKRRILHPSPRGEGSSTGPRRASRVGVAGSDVSC